MSGSLTRLSRFLAGFGHRQLPRFLDVLRKNPENVSPEFLLQMVQRRMITRGEYLRAVAQCQLAPEYGVTVAGSVDAKQMRLTFSNESEFSRDRTENGILVDRDGSVVMNFRMLKGALQCDPKQVFFRAGSPTASLEQKMRAEVQGESAKTFADQAKRALLKEVQYWFVKCDVASIEHKYEDNVVPEQPRPAATYRVVNSNLFVLEAAAMCTMENVRNLELLMKRSAKEFPEPVIGVLIGRWFGPGVADAAASSAASSKRFVLVGTMGGSSNQDAETVAWH
eukprot:NODE_1877_length_1372_cov_33.289494_g1698_i0.p1 GENE.NODE_1877_length_1372_cov_33.289494_g1698_i0~~NODE_1877_length_1372_cov_33.289494_g1698_i0.p1  ORF type:complete len:281 (-),score=47.64 NODE_1877_length_1372_cov_33.289494_g1698_i0:462-1304(-)